jgi:DNA-binding beta-propeller fold protein YncE
MSPNRRLSRRSLLVSAFGAALAACGSPTQPDARVRLGAATSEPAFQDLTTFVPRPLSGLPSEGTPRPPTAQGAVELVWQADGGWRRLWRPTGLAVDRHGVVTVVDAGHDRLVQLSVGTGEGIAHLGDPGGAAGRFRFVQPMELDTDRGYTETVGGAVAVDPDGSLYVADLFNGRIQRLDHAGRVAATWGEPPLAVGPLVEPAGIAVDARRGRVYVADAGAHRVHAFDRDGRWKTAWGGHGQSVSEFIRPAALAVDRAGQVYVADSGNDRIQVFDGIGRFVTAWGGPGSQPGEFSRPCGVAVDGAGRVCVAAEQRILVFSDAGVFLTSWDGADAGIDPFLGLSGIAVDDQGGIYVADHGRSQVYKVRPRRPWPTPAAALPTPRPTTIPSAPTKPLATPIPMTPTDR